MFELFAQLTNELRQNPRLRIGLGIIVALLLTYGLSRLHVYEKQLQQNYQEVTGRWQQLKEVAGQTQWANHAQQAVALREQLEQQLWQANTKGMAQAVLQTWLQEEIFFAQIKDAGLKMQTTLSVPKYPNLWQISAESQADFEPKTLQKLLLAIEGYEKLTVVERLEIRYASRSRMTLGVTAYFLETPTPSQK